MSAGNIVLDSNYFKPTDHLVKEFCKGDSDPAGCEVRALPGFEKLFNCAYKDAAFEPFTKTECGLKGWSQQINDCWLDSTLYAMFASKDLRINFSAFLAQTQTQTNAYLREIGRIISLYLKDIDTFMEKGEFDESVRGCKQNLKKQLVQNILLYNKSLTGTEKMFDDPALLSLFTMTYEGLISLGSSFPLIKVFEKINSSLKLKFFNGNADFDCEVPTIKNRILHAINKFGTSYTDDITSTEIFVLCFDAIDFRKCEDRTRIASIQQIKIKGVPFQLHGIVNGEGIHFRAWARCDADSGRKRWFHYDNQSHPGKEKKISMPVEELRTKLDEKQALIDQILDYEFQIKNLEPKIHIDTFEKYTSSYRTPMKKKGYFKEILTEATFPAVRDEIISKYEALVQGKARVEAELSTLIPQTNTLMSTAANAPANNYNCSEATTGTQKMLKDTCFQGSGSLTLFYKKVHTAGGAKRTRRNLKLKKCSKTRRNFRN